jgi:hypothetical protein
MAEITCTFTRYAVVEDELEETTTDEPTTWFIENGWFYLGASAASARVDALTKAAEHDMGWSAQAGTAPVRVDGAWGGRNYPKIFVPADELKRVLL